MNFKATFLALSLFTISCHAASITIELPSNIEFHEAPEARSHWGTCKTLTTGALVGGSMGAINYATDYIWPFNWIILSTLRDKIIKNIVTDARILGESVDGELLSDTAWISDWAAYLLLLKDRSN